MHTDDYTGVSTASGAMAIRGHTTTILISQGATAVTVEAEFFEVTSGILRPQSTNVLAIAPLESKESPELASSVPRTFVTAAVATSLTNTSDDSIRINSQLTSMIFVMLGVMLCFQLLYN
jgi:hypothetical protein